MKYLDEDVREDIPLWKKRWYLSRRYGRGKHASAGNEGRRRVPGSERSKYKSSEMVAILEDSKRQRSSVWLEPMCCGIQCAYA